MKKLSDGRVLLVDDAKANLDILVEGLKSVKGVADSIIKGLNGAIGSKRVTCDFARQMEGATEIKCSQFDDNIIQHM